MWEWVSASGCFDVSGLMMMWIEVEDCENDIT